MSSDSEPDPEATIPGGDPRTAPSGGDLTLGPAPGGDPELTAPSASRPAPAARPGTPSPAAKVPAVKPDSKPAVHHSAEVIDGRFVVQRLLGEGGMGRVYHVKDRKFEGREVALKTLLPRFSQREGFRDLFFGEVRAAQKFVSEYVCQIRDVGETAAGELYLTTDLVDGESLRSLLDREKLLSPRHALEITRQVLLGLAGGHEKGFIHRDIKPSNVMLIARVPKTDANPHGVGVRLLDFGIAGLAADLGSTSRAGTVNYMSPEQAQGDALDPRSDLFAVGVLLFEMLSGRRPFDGASTEALVQSVLETDLRERLDEIPNLAKPVRALLERALQKDRGRRFQSANEFVEAIVRSAVYRVPKHVPAWALAAVASLAVIAVVEGVLLAGESKRARQLEDDALRAEREMSSDYRDLEQVKDAEIREGSERLRKVQEELSKSKEDLAKAKSDLQKAELSSTDQNLAKGIDKTTEEVWRKAEESLKREIARLDGENVKLLEDLGLARVENQRLSSELAVFKAASSSEGKMVRVFDEVMQALEKGAGATAAELMRAAPSVRGAFLHREQDGAPYLVALCEAASALEAAEPDAASLARAETALRSARNAWRTFGDQALPWIGRGTDGGEPAARLKRAEEALKRVERTFESAELELASADGRAWSALAASAGRLDPAPLFAHAEKYGCGHVVEAIDALLAELARATGPDGRLDRAALDGVGPLAPWVRALDERKVQVDGSRGSALRLHDFAQRWYDQDPANDPRTAAEWPEVELPPLDAAADDWRHVLKLQFELSLVHASPKSTSGKKRYYRLQTAGGSSWLSDVLDTYLKVQRTEYDASGRSNRPAVLIDKGQDVLRDFRVHGAAVRVGSFPDLSGEAPPGRLLETADWSAFRAKAVASGPCLVIESEDGTRWYSPSFGLVREQKAKYLMELAWAD
jgi:serine/threonine protein kinase